MSLTTVSELLSTVSNSKNTDFMSLRTDFDSLATDSETLQSAKPALLSSFSYRQCQDKIFICKIGNRKKVLLRCAQLLKA